MRSAHVVPSRESVNETPAAAAAGSGGCSLACRIASSSVAADAAQAQAAMSPKAAAAKAFVQRFMAPLSPRSRAIMAQVAAAHKTQVGERCDVTWDVMGQAVRKSPEAVTSPAADARGPAIYRTKMAGVMLTRALDRATSRARGA